MRSSSRPLVAVELDLYDTAAGQVVTKRLCSEGPLFRLVDGERVQYLPVLLLPIILGSRISLATYGEALRVAPNAGQLQFMLASFGAGASLVDTRDWIGLQWPGRNFRVYVGEVGDEFQSLALIYAGVLVNIAHDMMIASVSTDQNRIVLDKPLLAHTYGEAVTQDTEAMDDATISIAADQVAFSAGDLVAAGVRPGDKHVWTLGLALADIGRELHVSAVEARRLYYKETLSAGASADWSFSQPVPDAIRGQPVPEIWGRVRCMQPDLIDEATFTYFVSFRTPIAVTKLTVGGSEWQYTAAGQTFTEDEMAGATISIVDNQVAFSTGNLVTAGIRAGDTHVWASGLAVEDIGRELHVIAIEAQRIYYAETLSTGASGSFSFTVLGPFPGQWTYNAERGTVTLGGDPMGGEIRVDVLSFDYELMTTAYFLREIVTQAGGAVLESAMDALDEGAPYRVGYCAKDQQNKQDAIDAAVNGIVGLWFIEPTGEFSAAVQSAPPAVAELSLSTLDIASCKLQQYISQAYRVRTEYARNWQPLTNFPFTGITEAEKQALSQSGILTGLWEDPNGLTNDPRAIDAPPIRTLVDTMEDALDIRDRLVNLAGYQRALYEIEGRADTPGLYRGIRVDYEDVADDFRAYSALAEIGMTKKISLVVWG